SPAILRYLRETGAESMTSAHTYLLLDSAQIDDLLVKIYQLEATPEIHLLYQRTRYQSLADVGPLLVRLFSGGQLELYFLEHWEARAGLWLETDASESELVEHLRSLIHTRIGSETTVLLRYHDPRIMRYWLPELPPEERDRIMGPILRIRYSVLQRDGHSNPEEVRRTNPAFAVQYTDTPWLRLNDEQAERLNRAQLEEFDQRLLEHIDRYFPGCLA